MIKRLATVVMQRGTAKCLQLFSTLRHALQLWQFGHDALIVAPAACVGVAITFDQALRSGHFKRQRWLCWCKFNNVF